MLRSITSLAAVAVALLALHCKRSEACSRVLFMSDNGTVLVSRSMDWVEDVNTDLWAFPAGMEKDGGAPEGRDALTWKSKYGSLIASGYDMSVDGINEKGLTANLLYLAKAEYPPADASKPTLMIGNWVQYALDKFETVDEAVAELQQEKFEIIAPDLPVGGGIDAPAALHMSVGDKNGDNAIFEFIGGKLNVHHSKEYKVMTNDTFHPLDAIPSPQMGFQGCVCFPHWRHKGPSAGSLSA